jgi:hypothetical protein
VDSRAARIGRSHWTVGTRASRLAASRRCSIRVAGWVALCCISLAGAASAQDELDDILGAFEEDDALFDDGTSQENEPQPESVDSWWVVTGDVSLGAAYNYRGHRGGTPPQPPSFLGPAPPAEKGTDYGGLQRMRSKLALQLDVDLPYEWKMRTSGYGFYDFAFLMNGRSDYTGDVLRTHERDAQLQEAWIEGSVLEHFDLKVGRQIVNWGRSESLRVLDIANPLDNRDPGLVDIEDIRRPLTMARVGAFYGDWSATFLVIPEIRFNRNPGSGSDFSPTFQPTDQEWLKLFARWETPPTGKQNTPKDFGRGTEVMLNITGIFSGWDVSLQAARFYSDEFHVSPRTGKLQHSRLWMVGGGANYTIGSWLVKTEIALIEGLEYFWTSHSKSRLDSMIGIEYYGINDLTVVLEVANRHIFHFESKMEGFNDWIEEDTIETALRFTYDMFNSRLHLTALGVAEGAQAQFGSFVRLSASYDVIDALNVEGGLLLFQEGNDFFDSVDRNDRIFTGIKYSF